MQKEYFELMAHLKIRPFSDTDLHQEEIRQAVYEEAPKMGSGILLSHMQVRN